METEGKVEILLVDDAPEKLLALESLLEGPGISIAKAGSGQEALRRLLREDFALIILDVHMPILDGFETAVLIRKRKRSEHTPIIFVSAVNTHEYHVSKGYHLGAVDYIFSPVEPEVLRAKVSVFVELHRKNLQVRRFAEELQQTNQELRRSREGFRSLVDSNVEGILVVDGRNVICFANPAACGFLSCAEEGTVGSTFAEAPATGQNEEREFTRPDGTPGTAEVSVVETLWEGQAARLVTFRDVTRRKRLEEQLRHSQKMESIGKLAGGIAHEFNNLLTAINGYSGLCLDMADAGHPMRASLEEISRAGERAAVLTSQLLAYSRKQVVMPSVQNLNAIVDRMREMLCRLIGEHIELRTRLDPELERIRVDVPLLEQVIVNLVVNARDAMPDGGTLWLSTTNASIDGNGDAAPSPLPPGKYVELAVTDTGTGMTPQTRERIFEPFFTTKEVGKGTGLGLSMVYGFVCQSGGQVMVDSESGRGSRFRVMLPVHSAAPGEHPAQPPLLPLEKGKGNEVILVVEDDDAVRSFVAEALSAGGYKVLSAGSGAQALGICRQYQGNIDLLLTDVVMRKMGGAELAHKARDIRPSLEVLYMTGHADDVALRNGAVAAEAISLTKPFSPAAVLARVREALGARETAAARAARASRG